MVVVGSVFSVVDGSIVDGVVVGSSVVVDGVVVDCVIVVEGSVTVVWVC